MKAKRKSETKRLRAALKAAQQEAAEVAKAAGHLIRQQEAKHEAERRKWARLGRVFKITDPSRRNLERVGFEFMVDPEEAYSLEHAQEMYTDIFEKMSAQFGRAIFERNMKVMQSFFAGCSKAAEAKHDWMSHLFYESNHRGLDHKQAGELFDSCMSFILGGAAKA